MPGINMPSRGESAMDKLAKALGIVQSIYGIKAQHDQNRLAMDKTNREADEEKRKRSGVLTPGELLDKRDKFEEVDAGTPGAFPVQVQGEDGNVIARNLRLRQTGENKYTGLTDDQYGGMLKEGFKPVKPGTPGSETFARRTPDGKQQMVVLLPPKPKAGNDAKDPKFSQDQTSAAALGRTMELANEKIGLIEAKGFNPSQVQESLLKKIGINPAKSTIQQQYEHHEEAFVTALLRKQSGATITKDEVDQYRAIYFPRFGDTPEVIAEKAEKRALAVAGIKATAGKAWDTVQVPASGAALTLTQPGKNAPAANSLLGTTNAQAAPKRDPAIEASAAANGLTYEQMEWALKNPPNPKGK